MITEFGSERNFEQLRVWKGIRNELQRVVRNIKTKRQKPPNRRLPSITDAIDYYIDALDISSPNPLPHPFHLSAQILPPPQTASMVMQGVVA